MLGAEATALADAVKVCTFEGAVTGLTVASWGPPPRPALMLLSIWK